MTKMKPGDLSGARVSWIDTNSDGITGIYLTLQDGHIVKIYTPLEDAMHVRLEGNHWNDHDIEGFDCLGGKKPYFECGGRCCGHHDDHIGFRKLCAWFAFVCFCVALSCHFWFWVFS